MTLQNRAAFSEDALQILDQFEGKQTDGHDVFRVILRKMSTHEAFRLRSEDFAGLLERLDARDEDDKRRLAQFGVPNQEQPFLWSIPLCRAVESAYYEAKLRGHKCTPLYLLHAFMKEGFLHGRALVGYSVSDIWGFTAREARRDATQSEMEPWLKSRTNPELEAHIRRAVEIREQRGTA